ncbi:MULTISPECIES: hypothetical protein [unclassified Methylobacterium]|uniref:hypothetical protein n=1 Tax=unclassified Methylobacterium TaxID=2615210 RepID=UPI001FBB636E|nr:MULTISPECIES: hypothetical protein [unclassified Methylobacterium]MCJ2093950.1 hypothetical protein [Methylobacterium sp. J-072]MCJ2142930.1 hypothetical protein [Methylobacterium sp. E-066]
MSAGLSFGALPAFADLTPDQQAQVMAALQQQGQPAAPQAPGSLLGQADPQSTGAIPDRGGPQVAMTEGDTRRLEEQMGMRMPGAGQQPGSPDQLLFNRAGMGGGPGGFTGTADPMGSRMVPTPPQRPSDADLAALPATEPVVAGTNPGALPAQTVASSAYRPDAPAVGPRSAGMPPSGRFADPSQTAPPDPGQFDPLSGQITAGQPRPLGAPQGAVSPSGAAAASGQAGGTGGQPGVMERFVQGVNNPDFSNLMLNLGIGLLTQRGLGAGIGVGLQGYQQSRMGDVKQQLELYKMQQDMQQQAAARNFVKSRGGSPELQALAAASPSSVLTGGLTGLNVQPPANYRMCADGQGYEYIPGSEADPEMKAKLAAAGRDGSYTLSPGQTRYDEEGKPVTAVPAAPRELRPGATLYDPVTLKPIVSAPSAKPDGFDTETKLRGEFSKQLGSFSDVHDGYNRIISATKIRQDDPKAVSPASDMGLIFGFMKMLDPSSVVREGEYETARKTAGVPDRVWSAYEKLRNGQILTDGQRQDFLGQATSIYNGARNTAQGVAERYRDLATKYGVDPDRATYLPEAPTPPKLGQQAQDRPSKTVDPAARYQQLRQGGLSAADAHARMSQEGF